MFQSTKLLYALTLVLLFSGGLLLAKYAPWADQSTANAGYANLGGDFTLSSKAVSYTHLTLPTIYSV